MSGDATIRAATAADVPQLEAVMLSNDADGAVRAGTELAYLAHLVARGIVAVAEGDGGVVGFGAAVDTGRARHLADLHVLPAWQGKGVGGRLLREVLRDASPRTTFASDDPRALPLYVRAGMDALCTNLYLGGDARRLAPPDGYAVEPASLERMAALELRWAGVDRGPDLPYWAGVPDPWPFVVAIGGREVAAGLSRRRKRGPGRWVDHVVVAPDADPAPALVAAVASEAARSDEIGACVLGPSRAARTLLEAGFRVLDRDTYLSSDPTLVDPHREIVNTGLL